jgi:hypothetical protein
MDEANSKAGKRAPRKTAPAKAKIPAPRARRVVAPVSAAVAVPKPENGKAGDPRLSPEERHRLIAEAAYFRASRRGFDGGAEVEDWLAAEAEIDGKLLGNT